MIKLPISITKPPARKLRTCKPPARKLRIHKLRILQAKLLPYFGFTLLFIALSATIDWSIFAKPFWFSFTLALISGSVATLLASIFALTFTFTAHKLFLGAIALAPLLFPTSGTGVALIGTPLPLTPYSASFLGIIYVIHAVPLAFLVQLLLVAGQLQNAFTIAATLNLSTAQAVRKILLPRASTIFGITLSVVVIWIMFDSSANLVYAGTAFPLAKVFAAALTAGPVTSLDALKIGTCIAFLTAISINHFRRKNTSLPFAAPTFRTAKPLQAYLAPLNHKLLPICCIYGLGIIFLFGSAIFTIGRTAQLQLPLEEIINTAIVLLGTVPFAVICGFMLAVYRQKWKHPISASAIFAALFAFTNCAMLALTIFRNPIWFHDLQLFPALIGAGTVGNGIVGMILSYFFLCLPLAYIIASFATEQAAATVATAKLLGAPRLRILLTILRENRFFLFALMGICSTLIVSQANPAIFIQATDFQLLAPKIVSFAEAGRDGQALLGAFICAFISLIFLLLAIFAFKLRRESRQIFPRYFHRKEQLS